MTAKRAQLTYRTPDANATGPADFLQTRHCSPLQRDCRALMRVMWRKTIFGSLIRQIWAAVVESVRPVRDRWIHADAAAACYLTGGRLRLP